MDLAGRQCFLISLVKSATSSTTLAVIKSRLKRHKATENIQLLEILTQGEINAHRSHKLQLEESESAAESWN